MISLVYIHLSSYWATQVDIASIFPQCMQILFWFILLFANSEKSTSSCSALCAYSHLVHIHYSAMVQKTDIVFISP